MRQYELVMSIAALPTSLLTTITKFILSYRIKGKSNTKTFHSTLRLFSACVIHSSPVTRLYTLYRIICGMGTDTLSTSKESYRGLSATKPYLTHRGADLRSLITGVR